jgi:hypothetical protein
LPTSDPNNIFGRIITRRDVSLAVVAQLQALVPEYIPAVEFQSGLDPGTVPLPPDPNYSYRGALDFDTWEQSWSPVYMVKVTPSGPPERQYNEGIYLQGFLVEVGVNFVLTNEEIALAPNGLLEDSAQQYADILGMAGCAALVQNGAIGAWPDGSSVAVKTHMASYPNTIFPYPENRRITRSTFTVMILVDSVLTEAAGPRGRTVLPGDDVPIVELIDVQLTTESPAGDVSVEFGTTSVSTLSGDVVPGQSGTVLVTERYLSPPFPSTDLLDNFERSDGALGGSWAYPALPDGASPYTGALVVSENAMSDVGSFEDPVFAWQSGSFSDAEVWAQASLWGNSKRVDLYLRLDALGNGYLASFYPDTSISGGHVEIYRQDGPVGSGSPTRTLITESGVISFPEASSFGFRAEGASLIAWLLIPATGVTSAQWTNVCAAADEAHSGPGKIGVGLSDTSAPSTRIDSFSGGLVSTG